MCISHVVLICNKGELKKDMSEVLKLVADSMKDLKKNIVRKRQVYVILNMLNEIKEAVLSNCVSKLQENLEDIKGD